MGMIFVGGFLGSLQLIVLGVIAFSAVVFFQLVNLPVEFDASNRAKRQLVEFGVVPEAQMGHVNRVLNAAALTYVAAALQSVMILLYYVTRLSGGSRG